MEEKKEINQISNTELIKDIIDQAVKFLISQNCFEPSGETVIDYKIGYIYQRKDDFIEALFEMVVNNHMTFHMAVQEGKMLLLKIDKDTYDATVRDMKNTHECLRDDQKTDGYHKDLKNKSTKDITIAIAAILLTLGAIIGIGYLVNGKVKLVDKSFKQLSLVIPSNYKEHMPLDSGFSSSTYYDNNKCKVSLGYYSRIRRYDFETGEYKDDNDYTKEQLYDDFDLEDKMINGKTWYYHNDDGKQIYDYINKNINYTVTINSEDDNYCKVDDIINSLVIK